MKSIKLREALDLQLGNISKRLALVALLFTLLGTLGFVVQTSVNRLNSQAEGIKSYAGHLLSIQDIFELQRYLNSQIKSDSINAYAIVEPTHQRLILASHEGGIPIAVDLKDFAIGFSSGSLVYVKRVPIQSERGVSYILAVSKNIALSPILFSFGLAALVFGFYVLWMRRVHLKFADDLSTPILNMAKYLKSMARDNADVDVSRPADSAQFAEINDVYHQFHDLYTDLHKAHVKEQEQAKLVAIGKTTQMLAHDVRKPFSLIKTGMDMLETEKDPHKIKAVIESLSPKIDGALDTVNGLIQDVMEVGSKASLRRAPQSPKTIVQDMMQENGAWPRRNPLGAKRYSLRVQFQHASLIRIDLQKVKRVVSNVYDNAVQAVQPGGEIWVLTSESDGFVTFTVGNTGKVIDPEDLQDVFGAFYTKGKADGTGLGLAIAHKIVTDHEGTISCTSSLEQGTEFRFSLPVQPESMDQGEAEADDEQRLQNQFDDIPKKIAVIEDNLFLRSAWEQKLEPETAVDTFATGEAFFKAWEETTCPYDLVITDYHLGESMNGMDIAHRLRSESKTRTMLCSNAAFDEEPNEWVDAVIAKEPQSVHDLMRHL